MIRSHRSCTNCILTALPSLLDFLAVVEELGLRRKTSVKEKIDAVYPWMEDKVRRSCSTKNVLKKFPVLTWFPKYSIHDGVGDLVAGITVGLTVVPQSLAYAIIAGLPPQVRSYTTSSLLMLNVLAGIHYYYFKQRQTITIICILRYLLGVKQVN